MSCPWCLQPREAKVLALRAEGLPWHDVILRYWPWVKAPNMGHVATLEYYETTAKRKLALEAPQIKRDRPHGLGAMRLAWLMFYGDRRSKSEIAKDLRCSVGLADSYLRAMDERIEMAWNASPLNPIKEWMTRVACGQILGVGHGWDLDTARAKQEEHEQRECRACAAVLRAPTEGCS